MRKGGEVMSYSYSDEARNYMGGHGIPEEDVQRVIDEAEKTGLKAVSVDGELNLAKLLVGEVTIYAIYKGDRSVGIEVEEVYSHRIRLLEGERLEGE